jgi:hypothetical protein
MWFQVMKVLFNPWLTFEYNVLFWFFYTYEHKQDSYHVLLQAL